MRYANLLVAVGLLIWTSFLLKPQIAAAGEPSDARRGVPLLGVGPASFDALDPSQPGLASDSALPLVPPDERLLEAPLPEELGLPDEAGPNCWVEGEDWRKNCPIYEGHANNTVRAAQLILTCSGFNVGPIDGIFGPKTRRGVFLYQLSRGLSPATGNIGPRTWESLGYELAHDRTEGYFEYYYLVGPCMNYGALFAMDRRPNYGWWVAHGGLGRSVPMSFAYHP